MYPFYRAIDSSQGILLHGVFASWMYFPQFYYSDVKKNKALSIYLQVILIIHSELTRLNNDLDPISMPRK